MERKVRLGVIGAGSFASRRHIPAIVKSPCAELVALCRRDENMLRKMAEYFNCHNNYTDYKEMLDSVEMDGVLITTPHALHYEHAKASLEKGLHVMIEKPMTIRSDEALMLADIAKDKVIVVALNPPFWQHTTAARNIIGSGEIGDIEGVYINWIGNAEPVFGMVPMPDNMPGVVPPTIFRANPALGGGGFFIDSGSHLVSELIWTANLKIHEVCAIMDNPELDMRASVTICLENGAICNISSVGDSKISRRVHSRYFGSKGTMFIEGLPYTVTVSKPGSEALTLKESDMPPVPQPVENFIDAILGRAEPICSSEHGYMVVEAMEAIYNSAKTGKKVELESCNR